MLGRRPISGAGLIGEWMNFFGFGRVAWLDFFVFCVLFRALEKVLSQRNDLGTIHVS